MKQVVIAALLLAATIGSAKAESSQPGVRVAISGDDLRILEATLLGMTENGYGLSAPLEGYVLTLVEKGDIYVVYFSDPNRPAGVMGSSPNMQEFQVQLRKDDLAFINWVGVK